jgi:hypothetical protein
MLTASNAFSQQWHQAEDVQGYDKGLVSNIIFRVDKEDCRKAALHPGQANLCLDLPWSLGV